MTAPFREEFVDANVPDHKLRSSGHCPWCGAEQTIDPNEVDGVCTACNARYSTESALNAKPRTRRRWRRTQTEPPPTPFAEPVPAVVSVQQPREPYPSQAEIERAARAAVIFVAFVLPAIFTVIFAGFAISALLH